MSIRVFISLGGIFNVIVHFRYSLFTARDVFISTFNRYFFFLFSFLNCSTRYSILICTFFFSLIFRSSIIFRPPKNWKSLAGTNFGGKKTGGNAIKKYRQTHNSDYEAQVWVSGCVFFSKHLSRRVPNRLVLSWNVSSKNSKNYHVLLRKYSMGPRRNIFDIRFLLAYIFFFFFLFTNYTNSSRNRVKETTTTRKLWINNNIKVLNYKNIPTRDSIVCKFVDL